ncbi:MAG: hypothetical protein IJE78_14615 [Bacteroidaceae bacterium]|nr:hypothetical protein [Bacteroidaceae bacterium]
MNKKVLSAILFSALFAGTGTFTSCIDNDEPAGIEELRGAKAELIRAKVAVEQANAAYRLAQAEHEKALAAQAQAKVAFEEAQARKEAALAAREEALTASEKAKYDKQIAEYQAQMEQYAAVHEKLMFQKEQALAEAKFSYEMALKHIEIAKAICTDDISKTTIYALETAVQTAYDAIYAIPQGGKVSLQDRIRTAEKELYNAMLDKAAAQDSKDDKGNTVVNYVPQLELNLEREKAEVVAAEEKVELLKSFLEKDTETTDWRAEIETLNDSVEILKVEKNAKDIESTKLLASEEYLAAFQKVHGIGEYDKDKDGNYQYDSEGYVKFKGGKALENGTMLNLKDSIALYHASVGAAKYDDKDVERIELNLSEVKVAANAQLANAIDKAVFFYNSDIKGADDAEITTAAWDKANVVFSLPAVDDYRLPDYGTELTVDNYKPMAYLAQVEAWVAALDTASVIANDTALAKLRIAPYEKAVADADTTHQAALALWNVALKAMGGEATPVSTAAVDSAVSKYNKAITTLNNAYAAYNTKYDELYTAEYNKHKTDKYNEAYYTAFVDKAKTSLSDSKIGKVGATVIANIESIYTEFSERVTAIEGQYKAANTADAKAVAEMLANDKAAATTAANTAKAANDDWETGAKAAGELALTTTEAQAALKTLSDAITTATTAVTNSTTPKGAFENLTDSLKAYTDLAGGTYAQVLTDSAEMKSFEEATGVGAEVTVGSAKKKVTESDWYFKNGAKYVAARTTIASSYLTKMLQTEIDVTKAETALKNNSKAAFGNDDDPRAIAPTAEEVRKNAEEDGIALENYGTIGALLAAQDALQAQKDFIAGEQKLAEVVEMVADAKEALEAEIAANEALYAGLVAAIEAAEKANDEAVAELEAIEVDLVGELNVEIAKLQAKIDAVESVISTLKSNVALHLHIDLTDKDGNLIASPTYEDAAKFEEALKLSIENAEDAVLEAEKAVLLAEKNLQKAKEGKYDTVADKQYELDKLNAELKLKMEALEEATANLKKALEILAAE